MKLKRNKLQVFLYVIIGLAIIGVISSFVNSPSKFIISIFMMIGVAFVIFMIFSYIVNTKGSQSNNEMKKYRKAAKQTNAKYKSKTNMSKYSKKDNLSSLRVKAKRSKRTSHLTVIEGKKKES